MAAHLIHRPIFGALVLSAFADPALAQRADENAVKAASDAFGITIGSQSIGLYSESEVRGFSPITAGNTRIEGIYFDRQAAVTGRIVGGSVVRVGLTTQTHPFAAPTGVVDYQLRPTRAASVQSLVAGVGPFGGRQLDLDVQQQVSEELGFAAGASYRRDESSPGDTVKYLSRGIILDWNPSENSRLRAFWSRYDVSEDHTTPIIVPAAGIPRHFKRRYYGQDWATSEAYSQLYGIILDTSRPSPWNIKAGLFHSDFADEENYSDIFVTTSSEGAADHRFVATPNQMARSTSGEIRLIRTVNRPNGRYAVHLLMRGRRAQSVFGGAATVSVHPGQVGVREIIAEPSFSFGQMSRQRTEQQSAGAALVADWPRLNATVNLQKSWYEKRVTDPNGFVGVTSDAPWLFGATAAYRFHTRGLVYAGYTQGLEESGLIPENARNFPGTLPAMRTSQRDAGVRWGLTTSLQLVAGTFEIEKPYFNLNRESRFVELGRVRTRGVELSLTGRPTPNLTLVLGAVISEPRVEISGALSKIGSSPVAIPNRVLRGSFQQRLPGGKTTLEADVTYIGERPVNAANTRYVDDYATLDLGMRHRFEIGDASAMMRVRLLNVTDTYGWQASSGGALRPIDPRRISLTLAVDF